MSRYKKYDDNIRNMIIKSRDPYLFPELNIPRTTALYWIKKASQKKNIWKIMIRDVRII
jgi:hypothetical protein